MARKKITIIGAGNVGASVAAYCSVFGLGDILLVDIVEGIPQGKGLDMFQATPILEVDTSVTGTNDFTETEDSDLIIITAGLARKPGMSRDDLLKTNAKIVGDVAEKASELSPNAIMIVVSNPLDAMVYTAWKKSGLDPRRIVGVCGALDTARLRTFLAVELGVSVSSVQALVIGGHGDNMVPLMRYCSIGGIPVTSLIGPDRLHEIVKRTANGGAEIVSLLKTGSAYYAPAAATTQMAKSILLDQKAVLPCAGFLKGEYGWSNLFVGVPLKLGSSGVEEIIEVDLDEEERKRFVRSAEEVRALMAQIDGYL